MLTEEELKRLNEALADDNSYSAVGFDYDISVKTGEEEESSAAETSHSNGELFSQLVCPALLTPQPPWPHLITDDGLE